MMRGTRGGRATRRCVPLLGACLLLHFFSVGLCLQLGGEDAAGVRVGNRCIEREREALLAVRADIWAADQWLSPWERDHDCCRWEGVGCDHRTGLVVKLDLRCPYYYDLYYDIHRNQSKVNPSLLNLTRLRYLDLSGNNFGRTPIPSFIGGSLVNLEYLNLSHAEFAGYFHPVLGSLRKLHSLDLSLLFRVQIKDLHWLSHLSHLQYLDMSMVDLSAAIDWLHVINMLPALSVLRLSNCWLPNLPTTLPHVNFSASLSTLDLSSNNFIYSTWPLWLFNISSLVNLDLSDNFLLHGPIPDGFRTLVHLEVLCLGDTDLEGVIPGSLWELENLKILQLSYQNLKFGSSVKFARLNNLQEIELHDVTGPLPEPLRNISSLRRLLFSGNNFTFRSSGYFENLRHLQELELRGATGPLPKSIGQLSNLQELELFSAVDRLPEFLGNISNLRRLSLSDNIFREGIPKSLGNLSNLVSLTMFRNNITGGEPQAFLDSIGNLCNLAYLELDGNNNGGEAELTGLVKGLSQCSGGAPLETMILSANGHVGSLPEQLWQLNNLKVLDLSANSFFGSIPASFVALQSLEELNLRHNKLSGLIPRTIGKLSNLKVLDISSNNLVSVLSEEHFANLSKLSEVDMSYNNLSFNIHRDWIPPFQLASFMMRSCLMGPEFPKWLATQKNLDEVDLSNNIINENIPDNLFNSFNPYSSLNLSHNDVKGVLPVSFTSAPFYMLDLSFNSFQASQLHLHIGSVLYYLDLSNNLISGPLTISNGENVLQRLYLSHNHINGSIPSSFRLMTKLRVVDLSYNNFTGNISQCLEGTNLGAIKLSYNRLSGPIPSSIGNLLQLKSLHLSRNSLTGDIPSPLQHCVRLVILDLGENKLSGKIPAWLRRSLSSLEVIRLRSNEFRGNIPISLSQLQSLRILDLGSNKLSGTLLLSFHNLSAMAKMEKSLQPFFLYFNGTGFFAEDSITIIPKGTELEYTKTLSLVTIIDLSDNNLSGYIPEEITSLLGLHFLNLSNNHLEGEIPENFWTMPLLESLDLSFNQLSGKIPLNMSSMSFLSLFNVSYNNLSGKIPAGRQFETFGQYSYIGNLELCGPPLSRSCTGDEASEHPTFHESEEHEDKNESYMIWFYVAIGPGFVVGFWGFLGMLLLMGRNKRIAYFRFIDRVGDTLYVMVAIHFRRLKRKISS